MREPPTDREERWAWIVECLDTLNRRLNRLEALDIGSTHFGAVGDRLQAMDAKIENATKTLAGLLGKAEAMGIAHPEALEQIRDFVAEKKREEARADGERAG